ncbi:MAG: ROK family protein [Muribaculaceae bacterium]|nr:ROK family protein [Muribaculaceae bacterium]
MEMPLIARIEKGSKNALMAKRIIFHYLNNGYDTIANLAKELNLSVPTVNKFLEEMAALDIIKEKGKLEISGGRHPALYGLNPKACYFGGVDIKSNSVAMAVIDLCGNVVAKSDNVPYTSADTAESLDELCALVRDFLRSVPVKVSEIVNISVNISGRVNPKTGYSYTRFNIEERPLSDVLTQKIGVRTCIDNDTRAMTFGEYTCGSHREERDVLFVNVGWGIGMGIVLDGKIYSGTSGFAGEIGHMVTYNNEVICHCGKKGCLETEASGSALHRKLCKRLDEGANSIIADLYRSTGHITLDDILDAVKREDLLCLELLEDVGRELGRWLAGMINIFNPEKVIIGGVLSETGDFLLQPLRVAMRRYSLNLVNKDTKIVLSRLGHDAGVLGACVIARSRAFEDFLE